MLINEWEGIEFKRRSETDVDESIEISTNLLKDKFWGLYIIWKILPLSDSFISSFIKVVTLQAFGKYDAYENI